MHRRNFLQAGLLTATFSFPEKYLPGKVYQTNGTIVFNAGIGGNNTADLLKRIDKDCLAHQPDLTILMIGTNDMNSMKHIALPQYEANLRNIVGQLIAAKSRVLLMTILPVYEPYLYTRHPRAFYEPEGHAKRKEQVNDVIRKIAADNKQDLLDMGYIFQQAGDVGEGMESLIQNVVNSNKQDGVHPTPAGYRTMAVALYEYITQRQLPHGRVVCFGDSITFGDGGTEGKSYPAYLKKLLTA
ncbi:SGNH/GDSL hydrolase family protein [Chitinophaga polysaccharea]|uniref:SGNH/GDSL hydrolase family protein n=1 Tax=Chitinophaga polysaccharea TaxID=1293035 RepID=UPI0011595D9F|nr:SGNH/GDSL hydrolase family protein [Chitinophaga polysaccharea]